MPEEAKIEAGASAPASRPYILSISRRFAYSKRYNILKKPMEKVEHPIVKKARGIIMKLTGRKEGKRA